MTDRKGASAPGLFLVKNRRDRRLFCPECDGTKCEACGHVGHVPHPYFRKRGQEYREFRRKLGVSKIDAANRLGISHTALEAVEAGYAELVLRESGDG